MLELLWLSTEQVVGPDRRTREESLFLNPGVRWAFNFAERPPDRARRGLHHRPRRRRRRATRCFSISASSTRSGTSNAKPCEQGRRVICGATCPAVGIGHPERMSHPECSEGAVFRSCCLRRLHASGNSRNLLGNDLHAPLCCPCLRGDSSLVTIWHPASGSSWYWPSPRPAESRPSFPLSPSSAASPTSWCSGLATLCGSVRRPTRCGTLAVVGAVFEPRPDPAQISRPERYVRLAPARPRRAARRPRPGGPVRYRLVPGVLGGQRRRGARPERLRVRGLRFPQPSRPGRRRPFWW